MDRSAVGLGCVLLCLPCKYSALLSAFVICCSQLGKEEHGGEFFFAFLFFFLFPFFSVLVGRSTFFGLVC